VPVKERYPENRVLARASKMSSNKLQNKNFDTQKQRIIKVASSQMSKKGYKDTSLNNITSEVGIHKSTFFHYFKSKEELLSEIVKPGIVEVEENLREIIKDNNISINNKLRKAISNHLFILIKYRDNVTIYHNELRFLSKDEREKNLKAREDYANLFQVVVEMVIKNNPHKFRNMDVKVATFAILGMCNWFLRWYNKDGLLDIEQIADMFYRLIIDES
jgi:AcrR family transcriptional regulator